MDEEGREEEGEVNYSSFLRLIVRAIPAMAKEGNATTAQ